MDRSIRVASALAIAGIGCGAAAILSYPAPAMASTTISTGPTSLAEHFWLDPTNWGGQVPPAIATAEQATITAPTVAPDANVTYAWIMTNSRDWEQIGVAWFAGSQPYIFADAGTQYVIGPSIAPGASVTVRLVQLGTIWDQASWVAEYSTGSGWQVLQQSKLAGELSPPTLEAYYDGFATPGTWLFRGVGYAVGNVWHHMPSTPISQSSPVGFPMP